MYKLFPNQDVSTAMLLRSVSPISTVALAFSVVFSPLAQADFTLSGNQHLDITTAEVNGVLLDNSSATIFPGGSVTDFSVFNHARATVAGGYVQEVGVYEDASLQVYLSARVDEMMTFDRSTMSVYSGNHNYVLAFDQSHAYLYNGVFQDTTSYNTARMTITGGTYTDLETYEFSTLNMTGGSIVNFETYQSSTANLSNVALTLTETYGGVTTISNATMGSAESYGGVLNYQSGNTLSSYEIYGGQINFNGGSVDNLVVWDDDALIEFRGGSFPKITVNDSTATTIRATNVVAGEGLTLTETTVTGSGTLAGKWEDGTSWSSEVSIYEGSRLNLISPGQELIVPVEPPPLRRDRIVLLDPDQSMGDLNYAFPLRTRSDNLALVTEAGGVSHDGSSLNGVDYGYFNPYHADGVLPGVKGYYGLDLDVISGVADVVVAKDGTVVRVLTSEANFGPVVIVSHGNGYFSEYREFDLDPYSIPSVGDTVQAGDRLGDLPAVGGALHFQVKHNPLAVGLTFEQILADPSLFLSGLSDKVAGNGLEGLMSGGVAFEPNDPETGGFTLMRDPNQMVKINDQIDQPRPLFTPIVGASSPTLTNEVEIISLMGKFSSQAGFTTSETGSVTTDRRTGALRLQTGSPVWAASLVPIETYSDLILFDLQFDATSPAEGLLGVYWDGELIGTIDERYVDGSVNQYAFELGRVYGPGWYSLAFRLDPFTEQDSIAEISNIAFAVPEPSSLVILSLGGMLAMRRRR